MDISCRPDLLPPNPYFLVLIDVPYARGTVSMHAYSSLELSLQSEACMVQCYKHHQRDSVHTKEQALPAKWHRGLSHFRWSTILPPFVWPSFHCWDIPVWNSTALNVCESKYVPIMNAERWDTKKRETARKTTEKNKRIMYPLSYLIYHKRTTGEPGPNLPGVHK